MVSCYICKSAKKGKKGAPVSLIRIPQNKWDREKLVSLLLCDETDKADIVEGKWKDRRICYSHAPGWHSWKKRWANKDEDAGKKKGIAEMLREAKETENGAKKLIPQQLVQSQESGESMYSMPLPKRVEKEEQGEEWHPMDTDHSMDEDLDDADGPWDGQTKYLISGDKLLELVEKIAGFSCLCYERRLKCSTRRYSTAAILTLSCQNCEKRVKWNSQNPEGGVDEREGTLNNNLPLASTLTGNSYTRLYAMAKLLNIAIPSPRTARRAMASYGWAAVEEVYKRDEGDTKRRIEETYGRKAIKKKKNAHLVDWRKSIINYLYAVREKGNGDPGMIRELMWAMFYHIVDTHRWPGDARFKKIKRCLHARVYRKKAFLVPGGEAMKTLCSIIDDGFIEGMARVSSSGSTSRVESFHSLSLMYTPKSNYVDRELYRKRTMCAILRYNWLRKSELDGKRGVTRVSKVSRKFRDGTTTKKVRSGGEDHLWMRDVLEVASFLKIQRRLDMARRPGEIAVDYSTASSEASHDSDTEEELSEFELSDVEVTEDSDSSSSDSEFEY